LILIRKPSDKAIRAFINEQSQLAFTYPAVDRNNPVIPRGYRPDHFRSRLGSGEAAFDKAKAGLRCWKQFDLGWARACPGDTPIVAGQTVAVVFRTFGLWCVCSARIVYVIDEPNRFGFAYGTLPGHVESGEEQFLVEREGDGTVWYDVRAFSRPRHVLTRLGYPLVRRLQKQFVRQSADVMRRAVEQG
jgi:uncharacterized protein (UPF0548 family)